MTAPRLGAGAVDGSSYANLDPPTAPTAVLHHHRGHQPKLAPRDTLRVAAVSAINRKIQERYGYGKDQVRQDVDDWIGRSR